MDLLAKIGVSMLAKFLTEAFFSKVLIYSLAAWSKKSENDWDDKVVKAMADALGVPLEQLKHAPTSGASQT